MIQTETLGRFDDAHETVLIVCGLIVGHSPVPHDRGAVGPAVAAEMLGVVDEERSVGVELALQRPIGDALVQVVEPDERFAVV